MKQRVVFSPCEKNLNGFKVKKFITSIVFMLTTFVCSLFVANLNIYSNCLFLAECVPCSASYSLKQTQNYTGALPSLKDIFNNFFGGKSAEKNDRVVKVYPGGFPLGFTMECEGVVVVAIGSVVTENGSEKPTDKKNIKVGDILHSINGTTITSSTELHNLLNLEENTKEEVNLKLYRGKQVIEETVKPALEATTNMYRLGLWIRDNAAGVGTLTFVREDNLRFGALGHPVCDIDTGVTMPISGGSVYKCNIVGFNKGSRGTPGELRGLFLKTGTLAGTLDNNNDFGVYGVMQRQYVDAMGVEPIEVGFKDSVKTGKATILTTIDGNRPEEYDIEIVKLSYQSKSDKKSMVIKVTDSKLINETGGIVQGMSGSPIIQKGKLVGAVTHVFVSDPTKGFGVYIDWMIDN